MAGVNLTFALEELLELRGGRAGGATAVAAAAPVPAGAPRSAAARGFVGLLRGSATAFEEVWVPSSLSAAAASLTAMCQSLCWQVVLQRLCAAGLAAACRCLLGTWMASCPVGLPL